MKLKSIFEDDTRAALIDRIKKLDPDSKAQWGKMNVFQMVKHCRMSMDMFSGELVSKRVLIGRLFGKTILKAVLKDDKEMKRNTPTTQELMATGSSGDFEKEKQNWIYALQNCSNFSYEAFIHPFFGKMTKEQIGQLAYKHSDHHLRQFGA